MKTITRDMDGRIVTIADLPRADTRWTPRRKIIVIAAIEGGLITEEECAARYAISTEELALWKRRLYSIGQRALRVTHTQEYSRCG
jgi:hypothetical protein